MYSLSLFTSASAKRTCLNVFLVVVAYIVLPNVPYWFWMNQFTPTRAIINIDYIVLGIIASMMSVCVFISAFTFVALVDAFVFVSVLYHFTPRELFLSMRYARYNPIKLHDLPLASIGLSVITIMIAIILAIKAQRKRIQAGIKSWPASTVLASVLMGAVLVDICNGTNTYAPFTRLPFYDRVQHIAVNPADSGLLAVDLASFLPFTREVSMTHVKSASQIAVSRWKRLAYKEAPTTNVALIIVESWGSTNNQATMMRRIAAPLFVSAVIKKYDVDFGVVNFRGSTTSAELRELCGLRGDYRDLFSLSRFRCLPDIFTGLGYTTTGMHGFRGDMFDRKTWWPRIGLNHLLFLEEFRRMGYTRTCGTAFPGLCDDDLIAAMADRLTSSRQFVYALTINSHLPLASAPITDGSFHCSSPVIVLHDEACALAQIWHRLFTAIGRNAIRPDIRPTQFIIVGDHSPPLLGTSDQHFSSTEVPYILLTPRSVVQRNKGQRSIMSNDAVLVNGDIHHSQ